MSRSTVRLYGGPRLETFELELDTINEGRRLVAIVPEDVQKITGWTSTLVHNTSTGRWMNHLPNHNNNVPKGHTQ